MLIQSTTTKPKPIFYDPTGIRWKYSKIILVVLAIFIVILSSLLGKYYLSQFEFTKSINAFNNKTQEEVVARSKSKKTFAFLGDSDINNNLFGSVKENYKELDILIINPLIIANDIISFKPNVELDTALEFASSNSQIEIILELKEDLLKSGKINNFLESKQAQDFIKRNNISKTLLEAGSTLSSSNLKDLYSKNNKLEPLVLLNCCDKPYLSEADFRPAEIFVKITQDNLNKYDSTKIANRLNQLQTQTNNVNVVLPSGVINLSNGKSQQVNLELVMTNLEGSKISKESSGVLSLNDKEGKKLFFNEWTYQNIIELLRSVDNFNVNKFNFGLSSLSDACSGSIQGLERIFSGRELALDYNLTNKIKYSGRGLIQNVINYGTDGLVEFVTSGKQINQVNVKKNTIQPVVEFTGFKENHTAITFDDGPAYSNTPKVLNYLLEKNIKATFFVNGDQINKHPDTLRRISQEGHQIENHTFSHEHLARITDEQIKWEINETNKAIENTTGYKPRFLRVPFDDVGPPTTKSDLKINKIAGESGLKLYQIDGDSKDFASATNNESEVDKVLNSPLTTQVLFHDGPDIDRKSSFESLKKIIDNLELRSVKFITVNDYETNNVVSQVSSPTILEKISFALNINDTKASIINKGYTAIINVILFVSLLVIVLLIIFLFRNYKFKALENYKLAVTAIVPCYNEEVGVVKTVRSLLSSHYPYLNIIVVDDGSTDNSHDLLMKNFKFHPKVKILKKPNGGKASALNHGLKFVSTQLFISMDADTIFAPDAIQILVNHFVDDNVAAVAGNVQVGNDYFAMKGLDPKVNFKNNFNWLTSSQRFEYVTAQNFEKMGFNGMGCVVVVPGAIGCFRTDYVRQVNGYKEDTLAEDTNLTVDLLKLGKIVRYDKDALCFTEAPETVAQFAKQRFRWSYGTMQVLWKNKSVIMNPKYGSLGLFALPYMVFGLVTLLILPLTALGGFIAFSKYLLSLTGWYTLSNFEIEAFRQVLVLFFVFLLISNIRIIYSIAKDNSRNKYFLLLMYPFVTTIYTYIISFMVIKVFIATLKGKAQGWGHLVRTGSVTVDHIQAMSGANPVATN
jgi:cellulose synthase/poly-beta-1,6-N-acetylglucosamine synthase-like glycosyltransferase/peptidoglycan/xylan/chitin deacetylase (PgdA/CDA1 family)